MLIRSLEQNWALMDFRTHLFIDNSGAEFHADSEPYIIKTWVSKNEQKRSDDTTILSPLLKIFAMPMTTFTYYIYAMQTWFAYAKSLCSASKST